MRRCLAIGISGLLTAGVLCGLSADESPVSTAAKPSKFDRLKEEDRKKFSARFEKELWPLFQRNGRNGCVGCHDRKHRSGLRFSGKADADFRMLLSEGFLLPDDPGSVLSAVSTREPRRKMPPGNRPRWTVKEIARLKRFVNDVDKKQQK